MTGLWLQQVRGILGLELRKSLLSMRAVPVYLLAAIPIFVSGLIVVVTSLTGSHDEITGAGSSGLTMLVAGVYEFVLRFLVYFACVLSFTTLFRGEVLDRSHYYFLTPVRREVLVAGKFVSAWLTVSILFVASVTACIGLLYGYFGFGGQAGGLGHVFGYGALTALACLGYGAVFLLIGLVFRNPLIPGVIIWLWELGNPYLPSLLKKVSVIFYLHSLRPVPLPEGQFAVLADPVPAWIGVPGLLLFTAVVLALSGLRIRYMEIAYGAD